MQDRHPTGVRLKRVSSGYCATLLGSLAGALMFGIAGGFLGPAWWAPEDAGLEALAFVLWGLLVGAWVGCVLGGFIGLRILGHPRAVTTAVVLAFAVPGAFASVEVLPTRLERFVVPVMVFVAVVGGRWVSLIGTRSRQGGSGLLEP